MIFDFLSFCIGASVASLLLVAAARLAARSHCAILASLERQERLMRAMQQAAAKRISALERGEFAAAELYAVEIMALSAEIDEEQRTHRL